VGRVIGQLLEFLRLEAAATHDAHRGGDAPDVLGSAQAVRPPWALHDDLLALTERGRAASDRCFRHCSGARLRAIDDLDDADRTAIQELESEAGAFEQRLQR